MLLLLLLLHNVQVISVLKVSAVKSHRLSYLKVLGDSESRRSGWSWCLVQVICAVAWSGIWRWRGGCIGCRGWIVWCLNLFSHWLTRGVCWCGHRALMIVWAVCCSWSGVLLDDLVCCKRNWSAANLAGCCVVLDLISCRLMIISWKL